MSTPPPIGGRDTAQSPAAAGQRVHAFGGDALADHDAVALADLLRTRQVSARELAEAAIARHEQVNPQLNGTVLTTFDRTLAEADQADHDLRSPSLGVARPFFAGIPTFVKDNAAVAGLPTRYGSYATSAAPARADAPAVQQLLGQGFALLGKTTLPEYGLTCTTERGPNPDTGELTPPTRNPWDLSRSAGGSSGGSAALTAAGVVPIAHANDGGGSIRIPASICGLVGLKPSRGRLIAPAESAQTPADITVEGVVTRTVRDTARYFAEVERWLPANRRSKRLPLIGLVEGPQAARLRVGVFYDSLPSLGPTDQQTRAAVATLADLLDRLGHHVEEVPLPVGRWLQDDFLTYWKFLAWLIINPGARLAGADPAKFNATTRGLADAFRREKFRLPIALARLRAFGSPRLSRFFFPFQDVDVLLSPTLAHVTPQIGYFAPEVPYDVLIERMSSYAAFTPFNNASGTPAISLPAGLATPPSASGVVPIGAMLQADHGQERRLLELAYEIEAAQPFPKITAPF